MIELVSILLNRRMTKNSHRKCSEACDRSKGDGGRREALQKSSAMITFH